MGKIFKKYSRINARATVLLNTLFRSVFFSYHLGYIENVTEGKVTN